MKITVVKQGDTNKHRRHKFTFKRGNIRLYVYEFADDWNWLSISIVTTDGRSIATTEVETRKQAAAWLMKNRHLASSR